MDATVALHAGHALALLLGQRRVGNTGWARRVAATLDALGALHLLDLVRDAFRVHRLEDVRRCCWEESEDSECAILLVLLKSPPETISGR